MTSSTRPDRDLKWLTLIAMGYRSERSIASGCTVQSPLLRLSRVPRRDRTLS